MNSASKESTSHTQIPNRLINIVVFISIGNILWKRIRCSIDERDGKFEKLSEDRVSLIFTFRPRSRFNQRKESEMTKTKRKMHRLYDDLVICKFFISSNLKPITHWTKNTQIFKGKWYFINGFQKNRYFVCKSCKLMQSNIITIEGSDLKTLK